MSKALCLENQRISGGNKYHAFCRAVQRAPDIHRIVFILSLSKAALTATDRQQPHDYPEKNPAVMNDVGKSLSRALRKRLRIGFALKGCIVLSYCTRCSSLYWMEKSRFILSETFHHMNTTFTSSNATFGWLKATKRL